MPVFLTATGVLLIAAALLDVFQTLFHPAGRGAMSDWMARIIWRIFRRAAAWQSRVLIYAGPTSILAIIVSWAALTCFGFALIYLPHLQTGFTHLQTGDANHTGLFDAMSLSIGALITLSEGSYATRHWLQIVRGFEAIIGFGLLTASVSWLLSIYPVLESRRSLAQRATLLHYAERQNRIDMIHDITEQAQDWLFELGASVAGLRNQMAQFPITYYFDTGEPETALAGTLSYLLELSERASAWNSPGMRLAGTVLGGSVHSFLEMLAEDFLSMPKNDKQAIMRAYATEQMSDLILKDRTIAYPRMQDRNAA